MTSVDAEANFTPAEETNPVRRVRDRATAAREDHHARMARGSDFVIAVVRPRWVIVLGWTAATQRKTDRWTAAANTAFAFVLLLVTSFTARGVFGRSPLMVITAVAATVGVLKLIRVQMIPPFGEDEHDHSKDGGYEVS